MSTYRPAGRPFYLYDFQLRGHRFHGSTGCANKRDADLFEKDRREEALAKIKAATRLGREPMTFGVASSRYWQEVGQHAKSVADIEWSLAWLQREIGMTTKLVDIDNLLVSRLVASRRGEKVRGKELVKPSTVNRTVTEPLRRIMRRARDVWQEPVGQVDWKRHLLKEPQERVRELRPDEEAKMFEVLREDYHPIVRFAVMTGCRLNECVTLRWRDVDWGSRQVWILGKGDKHAPIPMPPALRELLWPLQGHDPEFVFTYVAERARDSRLKGQRYPITYEGLKSAFRRDVKGAIDGYRFHDNRHTAATRVLRKSGNLKIVQKMLRHADISTTTKYAHVLDDDIRDAMEAAAVAAPATKSPDQIPDQAKTKTRKRLKAKG
ncbi:MAG: site-specific integrase [Salinarimonadaceae bacterium]|nr:MAG: site-specific integrase [Salinarimonadaceae bacterium]